MSLFSKLSVTLFEKVFRVTSSFIFGVAVVRYLGPDGYGIYSFGLAWFGILSSIAFIGLEHIAIKYFTDSNVNFRALNKTIGSLLILSGIFCSIISLVIAFSFLYDLQEIKVIVIFSLAVLLQFTISPSYVLQAQKEFSTLSKIGVVQSFLSLIFKFLFIFYKVDVIYFGLLYLFDYLIWGVLFYIFDIEKFYSGNEGDIKFGMGFLFKESLPLLLSGILITTYFKVDQIIIKYFLTNHDLGMFALAIRISEMSTLIPLTFLQIVFPNILKSREKHQIQIVFDVVVLSSFVVSAIVFVLAPLIINLGFGSDFNDSVILLRVLIWTTLFTSVGQLNFYLIIKERDQKSVLTKALFSLFFNITLCYALTVYFGAIGTAVSTILSFFFSTMVLLLVYKNQRWQFGSVIRSLNLAAAYKRVSGFWN
jgi:O-antigen/teichoic acid export membrane protein